MYSAWRGVRSLLVRERPVGKRYAGDVPASCATKRASITRRRDLWWSESEALGLLCPASWTEAEEQD